jgi:EAL domain-containing protein (putative c-di-GMP-specific phosphodiesterase class I)
MGVRPRCTTRGQLVGRKTKPDRMTSSSPSDGSPPRGPDGIPSVRDLIVTRQLRVAFQPIVDLQLRRVLAHEALVRTRSPAFRTPREMFVAAVRSGCCGELGRAIREATLETAPDQPLFLNVHPEELHEGWLLDFDDPIYRHPAEVYLEITEAAPLSHFRQCREVLQEIRERGIRLVIDDLGAGYSNLRYIADLHPALVKLDRALITGLGQNRRMQRLVSSIVALCENLGAEVVAEGVETVDELLAARDAGVRYVQGFLLARPQASAPEVHWPAELDEAPVPTSGMQQAGDSVRSVQIAISESPTEPVHVSHVQSLGGPDPRKKAAED